MYQEIFLFTTSPVIDYLILGVMGLMLIIWKGQMSWSKKYYTRLTNTQHEINDDWFKNMLKYLKDKGILYVPNIKKSFNKQGEEVNEQ